MNDQTAPAQGIRADSILFDDRQLARRARTTLAGADTGLLLIGDDRGEIGKPLFVRVADAEGDVLIRCASASAVARAAGAHRLVSLVLAPNPSFGVRLTLSGTLGPADGISGHMARHGCASGCVDRRGSGAPNTIVGLRVDHVIAGCPNERTVSAPGEGRAVPMAVYGDAEPDLFAANIPRVIQHINEHHADKMLRLAAYTVGVPQSQLAAACLTHLTAEQATLYWVDEYGAHPAVLPFPRPAPTLEQLAAALRGLVKAADDNDI